MTKHLLKTSLGIFSLTLLTAGSSQAAVTLDELLAHPNPAEELRRLKAEDFQNFKGLCGEIQGQSFLDRPDVIAMGSIKKTAFMRICAEQDIQVAKVKQIAQGEKAAAVGREVVHLRPVDLGAGKTFQESEEKLREAQAALLANAEQLGKKAEVEEKLTKASAALKDAQEFYDNLSVAVVGLQADLPGIEDDLRRNNRPDLIAVLKAFLQDNADKTPDQFIKALKELADKNKDLFTKGSVEQIDTASKLLVQANENLANARRDLEAINRELLQLTHPHGDEGGSGGGGAGGEQE